MTDNLGGGQEFRYLHLHYSDSSSRSVLTGLQSEPEYRGIERENTLQRFLLRDAGDCIGQALFRGMQAGFTEK